jgi:hypothetical protein
MRDWAVWCFSLVVISSFLLLLAGCGGASMANIPAGTHAAASEVTDFPALNSGNLPTSPVQFQIGDAPNSSDGQIVTFQLGINSITAHNTTNGDWVQLFGPGSVELTQSATTAMLVSSGGAPQETFDQLVISYSGLTDTTLDVNGVPQVQVLPPPPDQTVDLTAGGNTPIVVGADPSVVTINVNVPATTAQINPNFAWPGPNARRQHRAASVPAVTTGQPVLLVSQAAVKAENQQIQHVIGQVTKVVGNAVTVTPGRPNSALTFQTSTDPSQTKFENITLGTALNALVEVNGSTQSDGSLFADEVEGIDWDGGAELEGLLGGYNPSGFMYLVAQDGIGTGVTSALVGNKVSIDMSGATEEVNSGTIDLTGIPVVFDMDHVFVGQRVEVESQWPGVTTDDPDGNSGWTYPWNVELEQQTISGTVANSTVTAGQFDLVLPADGSSYLRLLNPAIASVHIYTQSGTTLKGISSITNGNKVQVRGLLFGNYVNYDPDQGTYFVMVAARITRQDN